jgi:hypothetical protein
MTDHAELDFGDLGVEPDTQHHSAQAWMDAYEADQQKLHDLQTGPDGEALARFKAAQDAIALDEAELKKAIKTTGEGVEGVKYVALFQERKQAPTITWHIETIKAQSWGPAVIIEDVDSRTFDALVKSGRITTPDIFREIAPGSIIKAVIIKPREETA